jgi:hypothetical protein
VPNVEPNVYVPGPECFCRFILARMLVKAVLVWGGGPDIVVRHAVGGAKRGDLKEQKKHTWHQRCVLKSRTVRPLHVVRSTKHRVRR